MDDYTGDEFRADFQSTYPVFSDVNPAYSRAIVGPQPMRFYPQLAEGRPPAAANAANRPRQRMQRPQPVQITIDHNSLIYMFMFVVIVFVCSLCIKSIGELKDMIRQLEQRLAQ